ncbi:MAG: hypothetical protein K2O98_08160, partial [Lachnospiraceae bacterium]|nr:hypothetical protein [Lachnospiraceae bacterium]
PKAFGKVGIPAVTKLVMERMKVCGCDGKIWGLNLCRYRSCHGLDESSTGVTARSDAAYDV